MISQLTFLRFVAASGVVIFHFGRQSPSLAWANALWNRANTAVSFFFALSGFILASVYRDRGIRRAADFYVARLARIGPIYWLALLAITGYHFHKHVLNFRELLLSALLVQSWWPGYSQVLNTPGWSLSVELFFYLCFPFLLRATSHLRSTTLIVMAGAAWIFNLAVSVALDRFGHLDLHPRLRDFAVYGPLTHAATFVVGIAGGLLFNLHRKRLRTVAVPLMLGAIAAFLAVVLIPNPIIRYHHNGLFAPVFVAFICGLGSAPDLALSRIFSRPSFVLLGEASYGIYILQGPVRLGFTALARPLALSPDAQFWSYALLLVLTAILGFKCIEIRLRERIKRAYAMARARSTPAPPSPLAGPG